MGKVLILNRNPAKVGSKVMQEHSVKKTACRATQKRILILRRRLSALLDEKESWEAKNQELIDSFNKEKKLNSELQKQVFNWQRLYHEAIISLNTYKVKHADTMQNISSCLKDMNVALPHLVGLSDIMCRNKVRLTSQLNSLRTSDTEHYLPKAFGDSGQVNDDLSNEREKRRKHKVGPMVKGVLIQKPTIRLERVMLHQPQSQEPANSDLSPTGANTLTPITEENEHETNLRLGQISIRRRRKHRLGLGDRWRMTKQEQLEKERQIERERETANRCSSVAEESSDSDNQLGPVIRLQRVSRLLLSPNLLEVERGRANEGKVATSRTSEPETHRLRADDPMEGCSWMNINLKHSTNKKDPEEGKTLSPVTSDSSDEESDTLNVADQENICSSLKKSSYKNQTFTVCRKIRSSSSSGDMSQEASDFSRPEPDSTSNILFARASSSTRDSLGNSSSASSVPARKQLAYSDNTSRVSRSEQEGGSLGNESQTSSGVAPLTATEHARPSQDQRRSSGFCNNCSLIPSPDIQMKRIRKPKIHLYPGEESNNPKTVESKAKKGKPVKKSTSKVSIGRLSAGRKSLRKSSLKKGLEPSKLSSAPSSVEADHRSSQGRPGGSSQKKKTPKKSYVKKSVETLRNSAVSMDHSSSQVSGESDIRCSRRTRGPVSYKESPLNVKMRRRK